jgi:hypothetical protein
MSVGLNKAPKRPQDRYKLPTQKDLATIANFRNLSVVRT